MIQGFLLCEKYTQKNFFKAEGNAYEVYWKIKEDYDPEVMEEADARDWDSPSMVVDEHGNTVEENVKIVW